MIRETDFGSLGIQRKRIPELTGKSILSVDSIYD